MDDHARRLAEQLEKLRHILLSLEVYMAQVRDVIALTESMIAEGRGGKPRARKRPTRTKRSA
jgi:hypothetical protein